MYLTKIISLQQLEAWRTDVTYGVSIVATNGCFDILHAGHVAYLERARGLGDMLIIGLNSDESVRQLKGDGRPINSQDDRAAVLAGLQSVSMVCVFDDMTATKFLSIAKPKYYVKGSDYNLDTLNQNERKAVESNGGQIMFVELLAGRSTSKIVNSIAHGVRKLTITNWVT